VKGGGPGGVNNIDANERNGDVVNRKLVTAEDDVMLITEKGILIRTPVREIRETGRGAAGVKLIKLDDGDRLVAMAKVEPEEEGEKGAESTPSQTPDPEATGDGQSTPDEPK
jgi:DNA gyrase subunit A